MYSRDTSKVSVTEAVVCNDKPAKCNQPCDLLVFEDVSASVTVWHAKGENAATTWTTPGPHHLQLMGHRGCHVADAVRDVGFQGAQGTHLQLSELGQVQRCVHVGLLGEEEVEEEVEEEGEVRTNSRGTCTRRHLSTVQRSRT
jgi:hypothetical protein